MKKKLFLFGLMSFFYVSAEVVNKDKLPSSHPVLNVKSEIEIKNFTAVPINDDCESAVELTVNQDYQCDSMAVGSLELATDSGIEADLGTADDDVWFTFTAINTIHKIQLQNIIASDSDGEDLVIEVYDECHGLLIASSDPETLTVGNLLPETVYYVRVYSYFDTPVDTTFEICIGTPPSAPANDDCENAVDLTVNQELLCTAFTSGTLQSATDSGIEEDLGTANDDVWYTFTAINTIHKIQILNILASDSDGEDLVIELYDDCNGTLIASSDPETLIVDNLTPDTVYYVRVYSYYDTPVDTTFDICITTIVAEQVNDECENAIALPVNINGICEEVATASLTGATNSGIPTEEGTADDDVWFSFEATGTSHKVSITNVDDFNTIVAEVFEGNCGELNFLGYADTYIEDLTIGEKYYVRAFSYTDEPVFSVFDICVTQKQEAPENDECEGAIELILDAAFCSEGSTNGNNLGATPSGSAIEDCDNEALNDVWFSFTVPEGVATVNVSTDFSGGNIEDTVIAVYAGTCGELVALECNDDGNENLLSFIENLAVNVGNTYYLRVTGYSEENEGTFCVEVTTNESLSRDNFATNSLKIYPNPVKDILHFSQETNINEVEIFNILGQQVLIKTINASHAYIDLSHLSSGAYLVKIMTDGVVKTQKIIKE